MISWISLFSVLCSLVPFLGYCLLICHSHCNVRTKLFSNSFMIVWDKTWDCNQWDVAPSHVEWMFVNRYAYLPIVMCSNISCWRRELQFSQHCKTVPTVAEWSGGRMPACCIEGPGFRPRVWSTRISKIDFHQQKLSSLWFACDVKLEGALIVLSVLCWG